MNSEKVKTLINRLMEMNFPILFFSLVVNHQLQNGLIFWVGLITLLYYVISKKTIQFNYYSLIPFGILIIMFFGVFYSSDKHHAWIVLSRNLGLLFLPVLLMMNSFQLNKKIIRESFKLLEISIFVLIILSVLFLILNYFQQKSFNVYSPGSGALVGKLYLGPYISRTIGLHNIYFSFFIGVLLLFKIIVQQKFTSLLYWISVGILLLYFASLKSANITLVLSAIIFLFLLFKLKIHFVFRLLLISVLIASSFYIVSSKVPNLTFELNYSKPYYKSSLELRLLTWNVAVEKIKNNPFIGVGTGDLKKIMTKGFEEKGFAWGVKHRYDPHNQFLSYWLQNGVLQLLFILMLFLFPIIRSIRRKDYLMLGITGMLFSFCLTESVLMTQTGLFASLILLYIAMASKVELD